VAQAKFAAWHTASGVPRVTASLVPTRGRLFCFSHAKKLRGASQKNAKRV